MANEPIKGRSDEERAAFKDYVKKQGVKTQEVDRVVAQLGFSEGASEDWKKKVQEFLKTPAGAVHLKMKRERN